MEQVGVTPAESLLIVTAAWVGFPILQTFVFLILPLGLKSIKSEFKNILITPVLCACLYVVLEWVQSWFLTGLTWATLGISQYRDLFFIQSLSIFGTYFPAFIIIFINAAIALYILKYKDSPRPQVNKLIIACILLYFANSYFGLFRLYFYDTNYDRITAQIAQGNISSYEKWEDYSVQDQLNIYRWLVEDYSIPEAKISVWPETAVPSAVRLDGGLYNQLHDIAVSNDIIIFTGAFFREIIDGEEKNRNAIMAFGEDIGFVQPYAKQHLVPFGEYLPLSNILPRIFPFIENIALFESQLTPGEGSRIMRVDDVNYGGLVCFDSIFPRLARQSVRDGADILLIVTNDSWFRDSSAIYQHNAQAVLRAVQNNRYIVRAANTGISSFISSTGRILEQTLVFERTVITQEVGLVQGMTIYTRFGEIALYLAVIFIGFCVVLRVKIVAIALLGVLLFGGCVGVGTNTANNRFVQEIQSHLEEKYGETFYISPHWTNVYGSFWRVPLHDTWKIYYLAHPISDETYVFRVFLTHEQPDFNIVEIWSSYVWRYLRPQLQDYAQNYFAVLFGNDIKVDVELPANLNNVRFPETLNRESMLDDFFYSGENSVPSHFRIFLSSYNYEIESDMIEHIKNFASNLLEIGITCIERSSIEIIHVDDKSVFNRIDISIDAHVQADYLSMNNIHYSIADDKPFWTLRFTRSGEGRRPPYIGYLRNFNSVYRGSFNNILSDNRFEEEYNE